MRNNFQLPLDTFYIMVAQKMGGTASPTLARKYGEAIQEVIYEQLLTNDCCYWHGFGNFEKIISSKSGKYIKGRDFQNDMPKTHWVDPKYIVKFSIKNRIQKGLNEGAEKLPRYKRKRIYKITPREYEHMRNARRRKEIKPIKSVVDDMIASINCEGEKYGKKE